MWCVRLDDIQLEALCSLLKAQGEVGPALKDALDSLELARWDDLPEAALPWDQVARVATEQGIGEADVIWDLAGRRPEAPATERSRSARRRRPRRKKARKPAQS